MQQVWGRDVSQDAAFVVQFRDPALRPNLFYSVLDGVNTFLSSGALPDFGLDLDFLAACLQDVHDSMVAGCV